MDLEFQVLLIHPVVGKYLIDETFLLISSAEVVVRLCIMTGKPLAVVGHMGLYEAHMKCGVHPPGH